LLTKAILISLLLTISSVTDIPVYWPILLGYFILLFVLTMRKRIQHMIKYKYIPLLNAGKKTYSQSDISPSSSVFSRGAPSQGGNSKLYTSNKNN